MGHSAASLVPATTVPASAGGSKQLPAGSTCPSPAARLGLPVDAEARCPVGSSHSHARATWKCGSVVLVSVSWGNPLACGTWGHWTTHMMIP